MKARTSDKDSSTSNTSSDSSRENAEARHVEGETEGATELGAEWSSDLSEDFNEAELRDFLAADYLEVQADPGFREGLRKKLWSLVSSRYGREIEED